MTILAFVDEYFCGETEKLVIDNIINIDVNISKTNIFKKSQNLTKK